MAGTTYHIDRKLDARQVLDILVEPVDDVREFASVYRLLKDPHGHVRLKAVLVGGILTHYPSDSRPPAV